MKTVSCIIPTRNRSDLLRRAMMSVASQTYKHVEIIVVDDHSDDNTSEVATGFAEQCMNFQYLRTPSPRGGSGARNLGILRARGEFVAFLDDDDVWTHDKIERQIEAIGSQDAVHCAMATRSGSFVRPYGRVSVDINDLRRGNVLGSTSCLLAKTVVMKDLLFDETLFMGEDWDLFIRIGKRGRFGYINRPLVTYDDGGHQRITNEAADPNPFMLERMLLVIEKHKDFFGPFWARHHTARFLLSYIGRRRGKMEQLLYTMRRCGAIALLHVLFIKFLSNCRGRS